MDGTARRTNVIEGEDTAGKTIMGLTTGMFALDEQKYTNDSNIASVEIKEVVDGYQEITRKAVTVTAVTENEESKVYDNDADTDPKLTATVRGLIGEGTVNVTGPDENNLYLASVTDTNGQEVLTFSISRDEGQNAGTYAITPSGAAEQGNYAVTYRTGNFTIAKRPVTVTGLIGNDKVKMEKPTLH